jgi:hypothetical protein
VEPYLSEEDKRQLKGKERANKTHSEAEGSQCPSIVKDNEEKGDIWIGNQEDNNNLATTIGEKITPTLIEAYAHRGGPVLPTINPMILPPVLQEWL